MIPSPLAMGPLEVGSNEGVAKYVRESKASETHFRFHRREINNIGVIVLPESQIAQEREVR